MDHFVMATAATKVSRPAFPTRLLTVDVPLREPPRLQTGVDPTVEIAHGALVIADKPMASSQIALRGDAKVAGAGAAGIGAVRALVDFTQRNEEIGEGIALACDGAPLEFFTA